METQPNNRLYRVLKQEGQGDCIPSVEAHERGVFVKWGHCISVATTWKNIVGDRKSAVFLCTIRVGWQSRPLRKKASFVEVAVAPINGHTSCLHRMHVADDEKMSMW